MAADTVKLSASITRAEWRAVALIALLVIVLTTAPYLVAAAHQTADWRFGGFLYGVEDGNSYLGKMRLGARGIRDFYLFYTPEPTQGAPGLFLPYIAPGWLVGRLIAPTDPALPSALMLVYHALRIVCDALLVFVLYRFIAAFIRSPSLRLTALLLALLGGGLGWLLIFTGALPPEFYLPEGFSFLILFGLPHLALGRAALLGGFLLLFAALDRPRWLPYSVGAGGVWWVVGLAVPFYFAVIYAVLGAWGLALWIRRRRFPLAFALRGGLAALITMPLCLYYFVTLSSNPAFAVWSAQNQLASPPPLHYLLAYGVLIIPALWGSRLAWAAGKRSTRFVLLVGWVIAVPLLVYLPINVQRRLAEGVIVPLAILAAMGLRALRPRRRPRARTALLIAASLSSVLLLVGAFTAATHPARPLFQPRAELAAFDWLNQHAAPDDVLLAAAPTGNALPAYTNLRPFIGHGPETLNWPEKTRQVERFYSGAMPAGERAALYAQFNIRYVFDGPLEQAFGASSAWADGLTALYNADGYRIYCVRDCG